VTDIEGDQAYDPRAGGAASARQDAGHGDDGKLHRLPRLQGTQAVSGARGFSGIRSHLFLGLPAYQYRRHTHTQRLNRVSSANFSPKIAASQRIDLFPSAASFG